jgi:hypothetical protein
MNSAMSGFSARAPCPSATMKVRVFLSPDPFPQPNMAAPSKAPPVSLSIPRRDIDCEGRTDGGSETVLMNTPWIDRDGRYFSDGKIMGDQIVI